LRQNEGKQKSHNGGQVKKVGWVGATVMMFLVKNSLVKKEVRWCWSKKGISKSTVHEIILDLKHLFIELKMLNEGHKSKKMAALLENLCHYQAEAQQLREIKHKFISYGK
jgi:hypothetical protein